jgi:hypothetical protein
MKLTHLELDIITHHISEHMAIYVVYFRKYVRWPSLLYGYLSLNYPIYIYVGIYIIFFVYKWSLIINKTLYISKKAFSVKKI